MRVQLTSVILLFVALALSTCQRAPEQTQAEEAAIQVLSEEWAAAFNAGDVAGLVELYTEDVVRMPPGAPASTGREAVEETFRGLFEQFSGELTWPTEEIVVTDGWAFHRGTYTARLTPVAGGEVMEQGGKVLVICQRQPDGSWKIAREIWNHDNPPPSKE